MKKTGSPQRRFCILCPYKSENLYRQLEEKERMKKEVRYLEEKAAGRNAGQAG